MTVAGLWWVLTERGLRRAIGLVVVVLGAVVIVAAVLRATEDSQNPILRLVVTGVLLLVAAVAARVALAPDLHELDDLHDVKRVRPAKPVLLCNPWSGGGKVEKFGLAEIAAEMGVETVFLAKGLDLAELARDAIAARRRLPGHGRRRRLAGAGRLDRPRARHPLRLHLGRHAQPLRPGPGLRQGRPAQGHGRLPRGRRALHRLWPPSATGLFVNNVSLGVYATIVQQDGYRDAEKLETSQRDAPRDAEPAGRALRPAVHHARRRAGRRLVRDHGVEQPLRARAVARPLAAAHDGLGQARGLCGQRQQRHRGRRDGHPQHDRPGRPRPARAPVHRPRPSRCAPRSGKAFAGVDGEALELETPLEFRVQPRALRLLVPADILVVAEHRRARAFGFGDLWAVARGRRPSRLDHLG